MFREVTMDTSLRNYSKTPEAISRLTPEQFRVTQQSGTELPNSSDAATSRSSDRDP
jgi:peptide methionine sulfoxide reductase MsrB